MNEVDMKKWLFLGFLFLIFCSAGASDIDSLKNELNKQIHDTTRVDIFKYPGI